MDTELSKAFKARRGPQAMVVSLVKGRNAVLDALGSSLRASREAIIHGVAPLSKGTTITCEVRLVANNFPTRCIHQSYVGGVLG